MSLSCSENSGKPVFSDLDETGQNSSYKPPGASYTAPGPYILQGNKKMKENNVYNKFARPWPMRVRSWTMLPFPYSLFHISLYLQFSISQFQLAILHFLLFCNLQLFIFYIFANCSLQFRNFPFCYLLFV